MAIYKSRTDAPYYVVAVVFVLLLLGTIFVATLTWGIIGLLGSIIFYALAVGALILLMK